MTGETYTPKTDLRRQIRRGSVDKANSLGSSPSSNPGIRVGSGASFSRVPRYAAKGAPSLVIKSHYESLNFDERSLALGCVSRDGERLVDSASKARPPLVLSSSYSMEESSGGGGGGSRGAKGGIWISIAPAGSYFSRNGKVPNKFRSWL
ncbi:hypothetical protein KM043_009124 [Ampulex compressa]|nr:hypothetical protein KM043_009124 [Ampulex compressa]